MALDERPDGAARHLDIETPITSLKPKRFAEVTPAVRGAAPHVRLTLRLGFPGIGAMTKISATQPKRHSRLPIVLKCLIYANR